MTRAGNACSYAGMSNVLDDEKQQQIRALGRLGWTLSRIQQATGIRRETRDFSHDLVAKRHATGYPCARRGARVYHVHAKRLYDAIGEPNNRHRRPMALGRAIERLMVLDAVLADPQVTWLATEHDKLAYFTLTAQLRLDELPQLVFRNDTSQTVRYFPDKLPIGLHSDGRTHVFLYVVHRGLAG